jgi:hypothetical protein
MACPAAPKPACAATDLAGQIRCIPGVTVQTRMGTPPAGYQRFDLTIEQPVDHNDPNGAKFQQRIVLLHRSPTAPMVIQTSGYSLSTGRSELTTTFAANQISIEHRYFTPSIPAAPVQWQHLTIAQSAADSHHIWEAFKWLYPGKWVNTGASKGGETAVYHRRFFPCDVDATVAYVAPLVYGLDDQRFVPFLQNIGGATNASCRTKLMDFAKSCLMRRSELEPRLDASMYTRFGVAQSFEYSILDVYWAFWQYQPASMCSAVPAANAPADTMFTFLTDIGVLDDGQDASTSFFGPYFYQAGYELGVPASWEDPLKPLLQFPNDDSIDPFFPIGSPKPTFRPQAMVDIQDWVKTSGQRLMFIYGEFDPWTGGAYELGSAMDSFKFIQPGGNHGSSIGGLRAADKEMALSTLERWLNAIRTQATMQFEHVEGERRRFKR